MKELVVLVLISLAVLSLAYVMLAISLHRRARKHAAGLTCASVRQGERVIHGCVCRDRDCVAACADPEGSRPLAES